MTTMHRLEAESEAVMHAGVAARMAVEQARQYLERHPPIRVPRAASCVAAGQRRAGILSAASAALNSGVAL